MNFFNRLSRWAAGFKIATQLFVAFMALIVLTTGLGGYAIVQLAKVKSASDALNNRWMPSIGHTTSIRASLIDLGELQAKHARAADAGYMDEYEEKMKGLISNVDKHLADYQKLVADEEGKPLFETFIKSWKSYQEFNQKVISLGRAGKQEDAKDISDGAGKSSLDDAVMTVDQLTQHSFDGGEQDSGVANQVYVSSKFGTLFLLGVAIVMGTVLALAITRGLLRQLGGEPAYATSITRRIAGGDLAVDMQLS